jgi:2-polyprenyl-6-methoxyphenol hydroxylase-like FAD-dependent oxidoreductase
VQTLKTSTKVGAGPAGLVLALSLLQNGVKVRIIEKTADLYIGQRGAAIMVRV